MFTDVKPSGVSNVVVATKVQNAASVTCILYEPGDNPETDQLVPYWTTTFPVEAE